MSSFSESSSSPTTIASRRLTNRNTNRYSVTALFSMAAEQDVEVEDDLARGMYPLDIIYGKLERHFQRKNACET